MAPEPVRGTRCDSSLIRYVGEYIAQLRGISAEAVSYTHLVQKHNKNEPVLSIKNAITRQPVDKLNPQLFK